jgi:vacuole morphology and inheritance protein 14
MPSSTQPASSTSSFERPNRLKAREEGGIRWVELLEKFKNIQEKARKSQRNASMVEDAAMSPVVEKEKPQPPEVPPKNFAPTLAASVKGPPPPPPTLGGHQKAKSSLSNLGRFTGGVTGRKSKK